jgi:hypothetical protein
MVSELIVAGASAPGTEPLLPGCFQGIVVVKPGPDLVYVVAAFEGLGPALGEELPLELAEEG